MNRARGRGQKRGLPSDNGLDWIIVAGGLHDEPEEHVHHIDKPDGLGELKLIRRTRFDQSGNTYTIQVESVTKHQLPWAQRFGCQRVD